MIELYANKTNLTVRKKEQITSGSVGVYPVRFDFSSDWDGLDKVAVFRAGQNSVSVKLEAGETTIPWEVLTESGHVLYAGVCGMMGGTIVLPTTWTLIACIEAGAVPGDDAHPPTPDLWQQELAGKGDKLDYTEDGELGLYAGDKLLSSVPMLGGGGGPAYKFGHGLKQEGLTVSVDAVNDFEGDNTLPMTAAGVRATVGNIEALLATI